MSPTATDDVGRPTARLPVCCSFGRRWWDRCREPAGDRGWARGGRPESRRQTVDGVASAGGDSRERPSAALRDAREAQAIWPRRQAYMRSGVPGSRATATKLSRRHDAVRGSRTRKGKCSPDIRRAPPPHLLPRSRQRDRASRALRACGPVASKPFISLRLGASPSAKRVSHSDDQCAAETVGRPLAEKRREAQREAGGRERERAAENP